MFSRHNYALRPRVQRRRLRWSVGPWILEGTLGRVPNRVGLRGYEPSLHDPDWDLTLPTTLYGKLRIRRRTKQKG